MSSNGIDRAAELRARIISWVIRVLIALIVSAIIIFFFFTSGAVSN
jgi:hypothetical protein